MCIYLYIHLRIHICFKIKTISVIIFFFIQRIMQFGAGKDNLTALYMLLRMQRESF